MIKKIITGSYSPSKNPNCNTFTPEPLGPEIIQAISVPAVISIGEFPDEHQYTELLSCYFLKLLAGDKCLHREYADISNLELLLWRQARYGNNRITAQINNAISRFIKAHKFISSKSVFTKRSLLDTHKLLCPKIKRPGFRTNNIRLGDPKNNQFAFYAPIPEVCPDLIQNLLEFSNNSKQPDLSKALLFYLQFIIIHPFSDGNGRFARMMFISIIQPKLGLLYACLLTVYLKNISRWEYYAARSAYLNADIDPLNEFYLKAITWVGEAHSFFSRQLFEYQQKAITTDSGQTNTTTECVILKPQKEPVPSNTLWKEHGKKGESVIYVNHSLLSVLDQFDYYLKAELRKSALNFS